MWAIRSLPLLLLLTLPSIACSGGESPSPQSGTSASIPGSKVVSPKPAGQERSTPPGEEGESDYLRLTATPEGQGILETGIVTFTDDRGNTVDLIGAVHMAEPSYYRVLNTIFTKYDAVLYELVAPKGQRPQPNRGPGNILSSFQKTMCDLLELSFQLDAIDYSPANFVHADLSPREFSRNWNQKEALWKIILRTMVVQNQMADKLDPADSMKMFFALFSPSRAELMKYLMARQFIHMEYLLAGLGGGAKGGKGVIIGDRNRRAVQVMAEQLAKGRKRLAIFYGAAHMPHMAELLEKDHKFRRTRSRWLPAWHYTIPPAERKKPAKGPTGR